MFKYNICFSCFQAFWICGKETRKHNRQCQPPVCWAGPRSARLRHRRLRLKNDEAMKPLTFKWQWLFCNLPSLLVSSLPGLDGVLSFCFMLGFCFPSLFFPLCLAGLFWSNWSSLCLKALVWIETGARGCVMRSYACDKHGSHWREKIYRQGNLCLENLAKD